MHIGVKQNIQYPKQYLKWDKHLFISFRKTRSESVLRNESIIQQQEIRKAEKNNHFRELRDMALEQREKEQNDRALLKQNIMEMYENLQVSFQDNFPVTIIAISTTGLLYWVPIIRNSEKAWNFAWVKVKTKGSREKK